jgi:hypothetical protein
MKDIESWSKDQNRLNWSLAVQMANNWRRMMGVKEVNYPYPGDPREGLSLNA